MPDRTDDLTARCRDALLKECRQVWSAETCSWSGVDVDDAAGAMAERERALFNAMVQAYDRAQRDGCDANGAYDSLVNAGRTILRAAREGERE